jgi:hypothetical protein
MIEDWSSPEHVRSDRSIAKNPVKRGRKRIGFSVKGDPEATDKL